MLINQMHPECTCFTILCHSNGNSDILDQFVYGVYIAIYIVMLTTFSHSFCVNQASLMPRPLPERERAWYTPFAHGSNFLYNFRIHYYPRGSCTERINSSPCHYC